MLSEAFTFVAPAWRLNRGDPGPSAVGFVFCNENGEIFKKYSEILADGTNNEAEYQAVILALKKFKALFGKKLAETSEIEIRSDSELLIRQLNGQYKIKEKELASCFIEIWNLRQDFRKVEFIQIPREENKIADSLVNKILDSKLL